MTPNHTKYPSFCCKGPWVILGLFYGRGCGSYYRYVATGTHMVICHDAKGCDHEPGTFQASLVRQRLGGAFVLRKPRLNSIHTVLHLWICVCLIPTVMKQNRRESLWHSNITQWKNIPCNKSFLHSERKTIKCSNFLSFQYKSISFLSLLILSPYLPCATIPTHFPTRNCTKWLVMRIFYVVHHHSPSTGKIIISFHISEVFC